MKKSVKSFIALVLAGVMLLGMYGCGLSAQNVEVDANTLVIQVEAKGYGSQFARALAEAYNQKQSATKVVVMDDANSGGFASTALASNTQVDIFFSIVNTTFQTQAGIEKDKWADLSDVYSAPLEGYAESGNGVKIADAIEPFYMEMYTFKDGKQYSVPWATGISGFMYNKTKWDKTNEKLTAAGQAALELPKTTNEMFALFGKLQEQSVKEASGGAYAFTCSSDAAGYLNYLFTNWWAQYAGSTEAYNFFQGKDANGTYTAEIFNTPAREAAYDVMRTLLMQQNGYTKLESNFQKMQKSFIKGTSIFSSNGEWIENEVSAELNPGDANIQYMRIPVISSIVNNPAIAADFTGTDAEKDAKLSAAIAYIDSNNLKTATAEAATQLAVSETTLQLLIDARLFQYCTPSFAALVPEYSDQIPAAKEFLKFMLSKEGQEIFMASTYGVCAPLNVDMTQFDYYANATTLGKSKMDLLQNSLLIGDESNTYPMQYVSDGIKATRMDIVNKFAGGSAAEAKSVMNEEYNYYLTVWKDLMNAAGVSN